MDLSGEGWTQWLHQSAGTPDEPVAGLIGGLRPRNYALWEPLFDLVHGTVLFPFDILPEVAASGATLRPIRTSV